MNFGWGDVEEGAVCTTKYMLHSKHPLKQSVSFSSRGYSIYSFAQPGVLAQHRGKELWMLALVFLLFSFPFPFTIFYSKTCRIELCMVRSWILSFFCHGLCFLSKCVSKTCTCELWTTTSQLLNTPY